MEKRSTVLGTVSFEDLEGGFWGITGTEGSRYVPIEQLPKHVRVNGLRIRAIIEPVHVLGTSMWGKHVHVHAIDRDET